MAALNISSQLLVKQADVVWCTSLSDPCHSLSDSTILLTACSYIFLNEVKGINDTTALLAVEGGPQDGHKTNQNQQRFLEETQRRHALLRFPCAGRSG